MLRTVKRGVFLSVSFGFGWYGYQSYKNMGHVKDLHVDYIHKTVPPRSVSLTRLQRVPEFDVIVIGGGAVGAGVALDAATRGLSVALLEKDDFGSGTSSRSTKLLHGGVRYLENAIKHLDYGQWLLVSEALAERRHLLVNAAHLSRPLPILLPIYNWLEVPQYWVGLHLYDFIAGTNTGVGRSYLMGKEETLRQFPTLKEEGLKCSVVYSDGQHNDGRMNVAIAITAAQNGAAIANHIEVVKLLRDNPEKPNKINGVLVRDNLTGSEFSIHGKVVVNATGPFTDQIRKMEDPNNNSIITPSTGAHIVLPSYLCPPSLGLLNPKTKDGRVLFVLPFEGTTLVGTTDHIEKHVSDLPAPTSQDIDFILEDLNQLLEPSVRVEKKDIMAAWTGIRPLSLDPNNKTNTAKISRTHVVYVSDSNLLTVTGGKWTTYRQMAEDTVDKAVQMGNFTNNVGKCVTQKLPLLGAHHFHQNLHVSIAKEYDIPTEIAQHLTHSYGDQARKVAEIAKKSQNWKKISPQFPYLEAEIEYAVESEYACTAVDILARRTRLAFLSSSESRKALPRVVDLLGEKLNWDRKTKSLQLEEGYRFLQTMQPPQSDKDKL